MIIGWPSQAVRFLWRNGDSGTGRSSVPRRERCFPVGHLANGPANVIVPARPRRLARRLPAGIRGASAEAAGHEWSGPTLPATGKRPYTDLRRHPSSLRGAGARGVRAQMNGLLVGTGCGVEQTAEIAQTKSVPRLSVPFLHQRRMSGGTGVAGIPSVAALQASHRER